jgi:hypothetical protein
LVIGVRNAEPVTVLDAIEQGADRLESVRRTISDRLD